MADDLEARDTLVAMDAELRGILINIKQRQAKGKSASGRYARCWLGIRSRE